MVLRFCSRDKLAWMLVYDREYLVTLVRAEAHFETILSIDDLLGVINSTIPGSRENDRDLDEFKLDVGVRDRFGISVSEAERLKECYISMKIHNGHPI